MIGSLSLGLSVSLGLHSQVLGLCLRLSLHVGMHMRLCLQVLGLCLQNMIRMLRNGFVLFVCYVSR